MNRLLMLLTLVLSLSFASCAGGNKKAENTAAVKSETAAKVLTPEDVMANGASLVGQTVEITGTVTHICRHGGKKCSIMGNTPEAAVQILAGEINVFPNEAMGTNIQVKGIVKERQITKEIVAEQEAALKAKAENAETPEVKEHCSHSMHNVDLMKQWMADNNKEYYPVYYVEGISYTTVE